MEKNVRYTLDTRAILVGDGVLAEAASMFSRMFPGKKAIIVADSTTYEIAGMDVYDSFVSSGIRQEEPFIFRSRGLFAEWGFVEELLACLEGTDAIAVAVGSGVINDITKYVSHILGRRYMSIGTTASMDGYAAYGASITRDGKKQTFDCAAPYAFLMDSRIAASAPGGLVASGYADLLAKITAGADWIIADCAGTEKIDPFVWSMEQDGLKASLSHPEAIGGGNICETGALCEGLLLSGLAMQLYQTSRPASGMEHLLAHCWDMDGLSYPDGRLVSHGFKVGIGTLVSTAIFEFLLGKDLSSIDVDRCVSDWPEWPVLENRIRDTFSGRQGHLELSLAESAEKYVSADELRSRLVAFRNGWPELKERIREQIIPFGEIRSMLEKVSAPCEPEQICLSREQLRETFRFLPFLRRRFTAIDLIYSLGWMSELEDFLFGRGGRWEVL